MAEEGKTSISKASSYEEIGEFWDTNTFADYMDDSPIVDFNTSDIRSSEIYFHVETALAQKIRTIAKRKGLSGTTLLNLWVREKLSEENL